MNRYYALARLRSLVRLRVTYSAQVRRTLYKRLLGEKRKTKTKTKTRTKKTRLRGRDLQHWPQQVAVHSEATKPRVRYSSSSEVGSPVPSTRTHTLAFPTFTLFTLLVLFPFPFLFLFLFHIFFGSGTSNRTAVLVALTGYWCSAVQAGTGRCKAPPPPPLCLSGSPGVRDQRRSVSGIFTSTRTFENAQRSPLTRSIRTLPFV